MPEGTRLRRRVERALDAHGPAVVAHAAAVFPYAAPSELRHDGCRALCETALRLLVEAVRDGALDARSAGLDSLLQLAQEQRIDARQLFGLVYLIERTALDEITPDERLGSDSAAWGAVARTVRRASFDLLGAYVERLLDTPHTAALADPLTRLPGRRLIEAVIEKELHRAQRFGHPLAVVLFDVDRLAPLNTAHGYALGNRILERIGIVMGRYFREHDWVGRWSDDTFVVLLPETAPAHAELLAERVRGMFEDRLALLDYRTDERMPVTVSVAVVIAEAVDRTLTTARLVSQAEEAVRRAKQAGRNRVERVDVSAPYFSLLGAARHVGVTPDELLRLVRAGRLAATDGERDLRFERGSVEALRRARATAESV